MGQPSYPARAPAREDQPAPRLPFYFFPPETARWAHVVSTDASSTSRVNLAPDLARRRRRSLSSIRAIKAMIPFPECVYLNPCPSTVIPPSRRSFLATRLLAPTPATRRTPPPYSSHSGERRRPPLLSLAPYFSSSSCASSGLNLPNFHAAEPRNDPRPELAAAGTTPASNLPHVRAPRHPRPRHRVRLIVLNI